ncbi:MAG TPA: sensor histidine kinase [Thermoanaerobaculia bacterium]|nr:sensor histidine kinase [Thermoanaerobaculia bacterium]
MRLLPPRSTLGWTPYAWLIYLTMLFVHPVLAPPSALQWTLTIVAVLAFLGLYFRAFWVEGRRLLPLIGGMVALGLLLAPTNPGATVFFIYAASFVSRAGPPAYAYRLLGLVVLVQLLHVWWFAIPRQGWVPGVVFSALIGALNIHFVTEQRRNSRLRLAQEEVERLAKVAERERIARDLHDLLGHTLSLITLKAELAARLAERDPQRARREMEEVEQVSRQALAEVREAVQGYRESGLAAELIGARVAFETAGIELELVTGPYSVAPRVEAVAALALREAMTNVVRHSRARSCRIELAQADGRLRLAVADDGAGSRAREGAGLAGMRERVEAVGGRLERSVGSGTRLVVLLPVHVEALPGDEATRALAGGRG